MVVISVVSSLGGHTGYLVVAIGTHALVGYTLGAALFDEPRAGLLGGVVADIDFLFPATWGQPFVHRGITHTAVAGGIAVAVALLWNRRTAGGVGVGYVSQLLIDATTPKGIPLAYPISTESVFVPLHGHSAVATIIFWMACLAVLWRRRNGSRTDGTTDSRTRASLTDVVRWVIRRTGGFFS